MPNYDEIANIPHADATDKQITDLLAKLKTFKEDDSGRESTMQIRDREIGALFWRYGRASEVTAKQKVREKAKAERLPHYLSGALSI